MNNPKALFEDVNFYHKPVELKLESGFCYPDISTSNKKIEKALFDSVIYGTGYMKITKDNLKDTIYNNVELSISNLIPCKEVLNAIDPWANIGRMIIKEIIEKKCEHKWVKYRGLLESYEYCDICDVKKECSSLPIGKE